MRIRLIALIICTLSLGLVQISGGSVSALSGSSFKNDRIIDDAFFFNGNSMSSGQVQAFLNAKVPTCDTSGTQPYSGTTRAAYGTSRGYAPPYTCMKDYRQDTQSIASDDLCNGFSGGNKSAAEIIYEVGNSCGISQKVILITLQKEQSLVTDDWPWGKQYNAATGYACPDTAPCDPAFSGFFKQVYYGARQFKRYARDSHIFTNYRPYRTSFIQYNPNAGCGGTNIYIQNQATSGLYIYTPYQPNAAALNNLYGTGDGCSAYGNRNFWRLHNDWFGPTTNDSYAWELVQESTTGKIFLTTNRTKHWVPGPSILAAWGLDDIPTRSVDSTFLSNFASGPAVDYVGLDINGSRFLMNQGKKYWLPNDKYVLAWGLAGSIHISAPGYVDQVPSGGIAGQFMKTASGTTYLLNGISKHAGRNTDSLSHWGQTSSNTTVVTSDIIDRLPTGPSVDHFVQSGGKNYVIDKGRALQFPNSNFEHAWMKTGTPSVASYAVNMLWKYNIGTFLLKDGDTQWEYLESNTRHPVTSPAIANVWGWSANNPLTVISISLYDEYSVGANLSHLATSSTSGRHYLIGKNKHWITGPTLASAWEGSNPTLSVSDQSLSLLPNGKDIATINAGFSGHPTIYSVTSGSLRAIPNPTILDAVGGYGSKPYVTLDANLLSFYPKGVSMSMTVKDSTSGTTYYLENGSRSAISNSYLGTWAATTSPAVDSGFLSLFPDTGKTLGYAVSVGSQKYLINGRKLLDVSSDFSNYGLSASSFVSINRKYMPIQSSSHLVGVPGSDKIWLLSSGGRYHIKTGALLHDLGYGVHSNVLTLHPEIIATLPEQVTPANRLIRASGTGLLYTVEGRGNGFLDIQTLSAYVGSNQTQIVPLSVFNKFGLHGWTSRVIYGTDGKIYAVDNGQKRWIAGPDALQNRYPNYPWWKLPQSVINEFPTGSPIIN